MISLAWWLHVSHWATKCQIKRNPKIHWHRTSRFRARGRSSHQEEDWGAAEGSEAAHGAESLHGRCGANTAEWTTSGAFCCPPPSFTNVGTYCILFGELSQCHLTSLQIVNGMNSMGICLFQPKSELVKYCNQATSTYYLTIFIPNHIYSSPPTKKTFYLNVYTCCSWFWEVTIYVCICVCAYLLLAIDSKFEATWSRCWFHSSLIFGPKKCELN